MSQNHSLRKCRSIVDAKLPDSCPLRLLAACTSSYQLLVWQHRREVTETGVIVNLMLVCLFGVGGCVLPFHYGRPVVVTMQSTGIVCGWIGVVATQAVFFFCRRLCVCANERRVHQDTFLPAGGGASSSRRWREGNVLMISASSASSDSRTSSTGSTSTSSTGSSIITVFCCQRHRQHVPRRRLVARLQHK